MSIFASAILVTGIRGDVSSATTGSDMFLKVLPKVLNTWENYSMHSILNSNGISIIFDNGFGPFLLVIVQFIYYLRGYRSNKASLSRTLKHYLCYEYVYKMILGPWFQIFCLIRLDDLKGQQTRLCLYSRCHQKAEEELGSNCSRCISLCNWCQYCTNIHSCD